MKSAESKTLCQKRIVESARKIIFLKGMESLTTREIAKDLRLTNGALYRHFKNKNEIISLLIDDIEETLLSTIRDAANTQGNSLQKLENIFFSHLSYAQRVKGTSFVIINEVSGIKDRNLQKKMFSVLNIYLKTIKGIIIEGMDSGVFRKEINPASASVVFFGTIQSMVTLWSLSRYRLSLRKNQLFQTLDIYKSWLTVRQT